MESEVIKVRCVNTDGAKNLTVGNIYFMKNVSSDESLYIGRGDNYKEHYYLKSRFELCQ